MSFERPPPSRTNGVKASTRLTAALPSAAEFGFGEGATPLGVADPAPEPALVFLAPWPEPPRATRSTTIRTTSASAAALLRRLSWAAPAPGRGGGASGGGEGGR